MLLKERWFWKLVVFYLIIMIVPITFAWIIMMAPPLIMWSSIIALVVAWWLLRSYRNWIAKNRQTQNAEEE